MKTIKFLEFYKGDFIDDGYELYIMKDTSNKPMYIGISRDSTWHRWFEGPSSHMGTNPSGKIYGKSRIAEVVERRLPNSWEWMIELWTKKDCFDVCQAELAGRNPDKTDIEVVESYMIIKYEPLYKIAHGGGHHEDPLITEQLDKIFNELFG
jgi:hypothetical protein